MNRSNYKFGKLLKDLRQKNNMTQEDLAYRSFINVKTLSNMENGKVDIDLDKLEILSVIFNIDLVEEYLNIFLEDSKIIDRIIDNLNSKDNVAGFSYADEIETLSQIENKTFRKLIRIKAKKLRLFFENMQIKDDKAIDLNSKKRSSPIMLYMRSIILYDLSLEYKEVAQLAIEEAKKTDENLYSLIIEKYKRKSQHQKNFKIP